MKREFIPYEEAKALKELGFDYCCFTSYSKSGQLLTDTYGNCYGVTPSNYTVAPLYQQAFRWFREKNDIHTSLIRLKDGYTFVILHGKKGEKIDDYSSYEEAELACIRKLIEIVKNEEDN